ncbi:MAG TPA: DNA-binding protein [Gammaproteobacteria bacterium]|jgi:predicted nucleic acid-binding protein|nr:DNA-binding protein [Gammaproteobacteria bacterium]
MTIILVDTCVITDLADPQGEWFEWSASTLERLDQSHKLAINPVIYSECSVGYQSIEDVEALFAGLMMEMLPLSREALFLAGKAFLQYRRNKGQKANVLPDFFIGAHAAVEQYTLVTRDLNRFSTYFPSLDLVTPN